MEYRIAPHRRGHVKLEQLLARRQVRLRRKVLDDKLLARRDIQCLAAPELPIVNVDAPRKLKRLNASPWGQADAGARPRGGDRGRTICSVAGVRVLQHQHSRDKQTRSCNQPITGKPFHESSPFRRIDVLTRIRTFS